MNQHCECPIAGYCKRHQMQKGAEQHKRCQGTAGTRDCGLSYWNAWEQGKLGATAPEKPVLSPEHFCSRIVRRSQVGTKLSEIIKRETGIEIPCEACRDAIASLDNMEVQQAILARDRIVSEIVLRAPQQANVWQFVLIGVDAFLHTGFLQKKVEAWFDEAIRDGAKPLTQQQTVKKKAPVLRVGGGKRNKRQPYTGWRGEPHGERIVFGPFESTIRHLTYHVWPTKRSDCWKWNLAQLASRYYLFNGTRCLGIVTDAETHTANEVTDFAASLGMTFDFVEHHKNNKQLREVVTWLPMLRRLHPRSAAPHEVVFSAHAKGTQYENGRYTRDWTDLMYQSCLDYWPVVEQHLESSLMTGSFREFGLLGKWHDWAYSGTFFWWRLAEIGRRRWMDVDHWFAGTESWPGKMCDPRETRCLFLNDNTRLYVPEYWTQTVWPEWEKWKAKMQFMSNPYRGITCASH